MSIEPQGPGWFQASDGYFYPPDATESGGPLDRLMGNGETPFTLMMAGAGLLVALLGVLFGFYLIIRSALSAGGDDPLGIRESVAGAGMTAGAVVMLSAICVGFVLAGISRVVVYTRATAIAAQDASRS